MQTTQRSRYQVVRVTDLRARIITYKIFRRGTAGRAPPIVAGIPTLEQAKAKIRELEQQRVKP
jgi:hypothetical protein